MTALFEGATLETNPGILKRGTKEVISLLVCQNISDGGWRVDLLHLLKVAMSNSSLPFNFQEFCMELISEKFNIHNDPKQLLATIQVITFIINFDVVSSSHEVDFTPPSYFAVGFALVGSILDRLSGAVHRPKVLVKAVRVTRGLIVRYAIILLHIFFNKYGVVILTLFENFFLADTQCVRPCVCHAGHPRPAHTLSQVSR